MLRNKKYTYRFDGKIIEVKNINNEKLPPTSYKALNAVKSQKVSDLDAYQRRQKQLERLRLKPQFKTSKPKLIPERGQKRKKFDV